MSVTPEELMALADGELPPEEAARVAAAVAADPALARRLEAERALRSALRGHLEPVAQEPVPDALTDRIARAAAEDSERRATEGMTGTGRATPAEVFDLAAARTRREEAEKAGRRAAKGPRVPLFADRRMAFAMAASLVLGLMLGGQFRSEGPIRQTRQGLVASGSLARTLDRQPASAGESGGTRILASFQRQGGGYCRVFTAVATSGIACREEGTWRLERTMAGEGAQTSEYRQAGSAQAEMMAAAQNMMRGDPLDEAQEHAVIEKDWR
ncbi:anti-sigma factor family protein [Novosphingobium sp. ZW T3_23]|uniref:anti-sigma factor family protein n=1 Tax=Novosphingobium sp. ZW T3_23 TaxID=3378084 RepID=UPI003855396B